jgi:hypothetical protein
VIHVDNNNERYTDVMNGTNLESSRSPHHEKDGEILKKKSFHENVWSSTETKL